MEASQKTGSSARRRRAIYSIAAVAGMAALVEMPCQLRASTTIFNDTFGTSTLDSATNTPTSTSTNYNILSTKDGTTSSIAANDLQGKLAVATTTGAWEAQALFTLSPVTLVNAGDSIEETMVFMPTNIAQGSTSTLLMGLYNSHGSAPTNALSNAGLSNVTNNSFATGNAANWEGYVGRVAGATGTDQTFVRPLQNGANTTSGSQDLLINTSGSGFFNNPGATNVTSQANTGVTLTNGSVYTDDLLLTLNANGSLTINSSLFSGAGTTGAALASTIGSVASASILTFDGLAFGALNKGTSFDPQLDVSSLTIMTASAATLTNRTWDPGLTPGTGSDGTGNWDTTGAIWAAGGVDGAWVNDGTSTAIIGAGGTAGTITVTAPTIKAAGITFNSGYTIAASAGSTLTLTASPVTVPTGATATISAPIAGTVGPEVDGGGSLVLSGVNTYTGNTTVNNGTLVVNAGSNLGAAANGLVVGTSGTSGTTTNTNTGALVLNTSATVGALTVSTFNTAANTIAINGSSVLTVNGVTTIGLSSSATTAPVTALTITGNELDVNNTMNIGLSDTGTTTTSNTTLDMSGLSTFKMNATGATQAFNFGAAQEAAGTVTLANTANTITTTTINVSVTTNNFGHDTLNLGAGTNVLNTSNIVIGGGKGVGTVQFAGTTGSVVIAGVTGGASTANITISNQTTGTAGSGTSTLNLTGHPVTAQVGTMIVGQLAGSSAGSPNGSATFDTGSVTIDTLQIANNANGTAANGVVGTFTLGTVATSTGVLTVNTLFSLANLTNTAASSVAKGTFTINGGVANINANIESDMASGALGTTNTTLQLASGTLNMTGHEIGPVSATTLAINNVTLPGTGHVATLANLGGGGINSAGLTMNGQGTLNLDGANTYTGATAVNAGGMVAVLATGSLPATTNVTVDGTLALNNASQSINSLNSSTAGALVSLNATNLTVATGGTFAGAVQDNGSGGALTVAGALSVGSFNVGAVNANANIQINGTSKTGALKLLGGPGAWTTGLDLNGNKLIVEVAGSKATAITQLQNQVAFGTTSTNGIFSSSPLASNLAIAVMDNGVLNKTTFGGVGVDGQSVLVGAELLGDSNADGHVDLTDLSTVLNNFGSTTNAWTSGNFDGSSTIDLTDLSDVLNNFGASNPNASDGGAAAAVATPEPASLVVLGLGTLGVFGRRRSARR